MFKAELEHQITLASNEERIKDIENDAADAMDDNAAAVRESRCRYINKAYTFNTKNQLHINFRPWQIIIFS